MTGSVFGQVVSDAVRRVFDQLGDILPGVVVCLEPVSGYQQLHGSFGAHAPSHKITDLEFCQVVLRGFDHAGGGKEVFAGESLTALPVRCCKIQG